MTNSRNLRFDRSKFYTLNEVFDRVGRFRFPSEWTGEEVFAAPAEGVEEIDREVTRIRDELAFCAVERDRLIDADTFSMSDDQRERHYQRETDLNANSRELRRELESLPSDLEYRKGEQQAFERKRVIETELFNLFAHKKLQLRAAPTILVDWESSERDEGFAVSFVYSWVEIPCAGRNPVRHLALVKRSEFDAWARPIERLNLDESKLTLEERVIDWLSDYVANHSGKRPKRDWVMHECRTEFPELSKRNFLRIWGAANAIPKNWKGPGPKS